MNPYHWDHNEANWVNAQQRKHLCKSFRTARPHIPLDPPAWNPAHPGICGPGFSFATGQTVLQYEMPCSTATSFPACPTCPPVQNPYTNARVPFNNLTNNTQGYNVSPPCKKVHTTFSTIVMISIVVTWMYMLRSCQKLSTANTCRYLLNFAIKLSHNPPCNCGMSPLFNYITINFWWRDW